MDQSLLHKPPLKTTTVLRNDRGRQLSALGASKRAKRHAQMEEQRDPGKRLMERDDLDQREKRQYTLSTLKNHDKMMSLWCEFHSLKLEDMDGCRYFEEGGPLLDLVLLRRFFFWLADSCRGNIASSSFRPSVVSSNKNIKGQCSTMPVSSSQLFGITIRQ